MNRSKANQGRKFQVLAALALSILVLAVGETQAAEPFKAWRQKLRKGSSVALARLTETSDQEKALKWLATDRSDANVAEFVSTFAKEPVKFVEGIRLAALKINEDAGTSAATKAALLEQLKKVAEEKFGPNHNVLKLLAQAILNKDAAVLKDKNVEDLLREEFSEDVMAALNITDEEPKKSERPEKEKTPTVTPTEDATAKAELERQQKELDARAKELERRAAEIEKTRAEGGARPVPGLPVGGGSVALPPPIPVAPGGGELDDSGLRKQAQAECDRIDALKRSSEQQLLAVVNPLRDALNEQFNQLAALQKNNGQQQQQKQNRLEELLPQLLQQALNGDNNNKKRNNDFQQPPFPQQVAQRPSNNEDKQRSVLDNPIPPAPTENQQAQAPVYIPPIPAAAPNLGEIRLGLPTATGSMEVRLAEAQVAKNVARTGAELNERSSPQQIIAARADLRKDMADSNQALQLAQYRAGELDSQLEVLKNGARVALPKKWKDAEKATKAEVEAKKKQYEQLRASLSQPGSGPEQVQQAQPLLQQYQAELAQAEANAKKVADDIENVLEEGDAKIQGLAKNRDRLQATVTKLQSDVGAFKKEETELTAALENAKQLAAQQQAAALGMQQQGTPLGSRGPIRQSSTGGLPSRYNSAGPSMGTTTRSANIPAASGNAGRGLLGK